MIDYIQRHPENFKLGLAVLLWLVILVGVGIEKVVRRYRGRKQSADATAPAVSAARKSLTEAINEPKPLPTLETLTKLDVQQLVGICQKVFSDRPWLLLQHGTCLVVGLDNNNRTGHDAASEDTCEQLLGRWKEFGPMMDDGSAAQLKDDLGWLVFCGSFRSAISIIMNEEIEPEGDPVRITILGFMKRRADFLQLVVVAKS